MSAAPVIKEVLKFDIEIVKGPHQGMKLSFAQLAVTIGRGPENDIVLANDPRASRQHAEIKQRGNDFIVVNLSQKNFVMVNGSSVQTEVITNESILVIGDSELRLRVEKPLPVKVPPPMQSVAPRVQSVPQPPPQSVPPRSPMNQMPQMPAYPSSYPPNMGGNSNGFPETMKSTPQGLANPRVRFYGIIVVVALVGWWFFSSSGKKVVKDPNAFRTSDLAMADVREAEKNSQELLTLKREKYDTVQYRRAQENFIRGFRDYQQGQYARAREAFQVVLNLDPENELAKRYFHLSKIKFDEMVKFSMIQGNRYREKKNWRMCQASYSVVMTMLQNRRDDPTYKEAKQLFEQCALNGEGRF